MVLALVQVRPRPAPSTAAEPVDTGAALGGTAAPAFTLTDQDGRQRRLADFQGKVVVLAFIDSRCTDVCPLTAQELQRAQASLGSQADRVQLLAVNANPDATAVSDVRSWTDEHGMTGRWFFLTGPKPALEKIWNDYHVAVSVEPNGDVTHTTAIYLLDSQGRESHLWLAAQDASGIPTQADDLTSRIRSLLAG